MDISMDIMLAHLLIKLTTFYVLSINLWLLPVLFLTESLKDIVQLVDKSDSLWLFDFCKVILKLKAWKMLQK